MIKVQNKILKFMSRKFDFTIFDFRIFSLILLAALKFAFAYAVVDQFCFNFFNL